ncbi:hypothetical protein ACFU3E_04860 [Streptomyces sp. NPDC057424]|uniref:hypothetical protein n=1 Tax=Streptomyces sp. NPDC057424 TaxID=3346127 RepID=UPI0036AACEEC
MAGFRDFLMRFRPAGSPGRAAPGGVPSDRSAQLSAELQPPLALLEQAEAEARTVRERAARRAEQLRTEAAHQAEEIIAQARTRARDVRAEAADRVRRAAETEAAELLTAAERDAAGVRHRAGTRMPALVDRVAALATEELVQAGTAVQGPRGEPGGRGPG